MVCLERKRDHSVYWAMLSKTVIQLSVDEWGCPPSLLVAWPAAALETTGSVVGLMVTCMRVYAEGGLPHLLPPEPHLCAEPLPTPTPIGDSPIPVGIVVQSPVGSLLLFSGSWCVQDFLCLQDCRFCFP